MNTLVIETTQCSKNRNGKKARKRVFKKMKAHLKIVPRHAKTNYLRITRKLAHYRMDLKA